jgi:hypothetical protein
MSAFPGGEGPLENFDPRHEDADIQAFAHIEGLCQEEAALLEMPEHERSPDQHERLRAISEELDRIRDRLHLREHHLGRHSG